MQRWDFFGSGPAAAYARQLKGSRSGRPGSLVVRGNQSRRDLTKVAQYEVLGQRSQRAIRPGRDDRRMLAIAELGARPKAERFYRPLRDGLVFCFISQHFVLGFYEAHVVKPHRKKRFV